MMLEIPVESVVFTFANIYLDKTGETKIMERWVLLRKGDDFEAISKKFHISPRLASLIRNRMLLEMKQSTNI